MTDAVPVLVPLDEGCYLLAQALIQQNGLHAPLLLPLVLIRDALLEGGGESSFWGAAAGVLG